MFSEKNKSQDVIYKIKLFMEFVLNIQNNILFMISHM